jgi:hypothetical protein
MAVIFSVCPTSLGTHEPLTVRQYKLRRSVCKPEVINIRDQRYNKKKGGSPLNVKQRYIVEAHSHPSLHLLDCCHVPHDTKLSLGSSPVLFDEIQFTVVFGIEIDQMTTTFNKLLQMRLLVSEIRLGKE